MWLMQEPLGLPDCANLLVSRSHIGQHLKAQGISGSWQYPNTHTHTHTQCWKWSKLVCKIHNFCFYIEIILCSCAVQLNFLGWNLQSVRKVPGHVYMLNVFGMGTHEYFLSMLQHLVQGQNPCNSKLVKKPILLGILDIQKSTTHYKSTCNNLLSASGCNLRAAKAVRKSSLTLMVAWDSRD